MVGALQQQGENVGAQNAAKIKAYMDEIRADADRATDTLATEVKYCRVAYTHDRSTMKVFLEASGTGVQKE
eukprot:6566245-Pyramimonas_sp.AAC.1